MKLQVFVRLGCLLLAASVALGQPPRTETQYNPRAASFVSKTTFSASPPGNLPIVEGQPYSAERVSEHSQTLIDGTRISTSHLMAKEYRDSVGRVRTEQALGPSDYPGPRPMMVEIRDPVAGYRYVLDPDNKVAHRSVLPAAEKRPAAAPVAAVKSLPLFKNAPETSTEKLGTKEVEGVLAVGTLYKETYAAGAFGNDRPIVATTESWYSPDLQLSLISTSYDPRYGESVNRLRNLSRSPPELELFQPPADYRIVDQTGSFTVTITRTNGQ